MLAECLAPVVRQIMGAEAADSWFFIRYSDPDWHLRLRFRGEPRRLLGEVLPHLQAATVPLVDGDYVWRIQLDTYRRETERYGGPHGIELSERIFQADSEAVLSIVEKLEGDAGADARWRLALAGTARLLTDFTDDGDEQMEIARRMQEGFAQEFRADTPFKKQLSGRLRDERRELETLLDPVYDAEHPLAPGFAALEERSRAMAPAIAELHEREAAGRLTSSVVDLVPSFVHMFNNRLLRSQARAHEVVLYDFVHQLMRSRILRERAMRKKQAQKDQAKNQKGNS